MEKMTVLITGGGGQLSSELERSVPRHIKAVVCSPKELDITSKESIVRNIGEEVPSIVINCAAYTAVDSAEDNIDKAYAVNRDGVALLADECRKNGVGLIHISTDFVFDGKKCVPYKVNDVPNPISVYGKSKYEGEKVLMEEYWEGSVIIRTAWLYSIFGNNFVKTMLRLFSERDEVKVVEDQIGSPTWATNLASFLWHVVDNFRDFRSNIVHFTDSGIASWYDFAVAIEEESRQWRSKDIEIIPVSSAEFPQKAARPSYSVLDKSKTWKLWGKVGKHWRSSLRSMLKEFFVEKAEG